MGEQAIPGPAIASAHQEGQGTGNYPRVVLDDADDLLRSPHEQRGVELDLRAPADVADLEVRAAGAQHLEALGDDGGGADEIAGEVGSDPFRPLPHQLHALPPVPHIPDAHPVVRAELALELEPTGELIDDHDDGR